MGTLRFRYEDGKLIPLDPLPNWQEGDEIEVKWLIKPPIDDDIAKMLEHTRGMWADWEEDVENLLDGARQKWDQAWRDSLSSL